MLNRVLRRYGAPPLWRFVASHILYSGLIWHWAYSCKGNESLLALRTAHIIDFSHKLRAKRLPNAIQPHNYKIFWQHGG